MGKNITGKLIVILQSIVSITFMVMIHILDLLPQKYEYIIDGVIIIILILSLIMQFKESKASKAFRIISLILSIFLAIGTYEVVIADKAINNVSVINTSIDNIVVVVRKNDSAKKIDDTKKYRFGIQRSTDKENSDRMLEKISSMLSKNIRPEIYHNITDLAQALIDGKVDAAIYNEEFNNILEENMEGYKNKVRVLYKYGLENKENKKEASKAAPLKKGQESFNVYISGIDVSGPIQTRSRSDVNIIATVNTDTKRVLLTTTPRDFYVPIPGVSGNTRDKLTHAGIYGVDASVRTLEKLYGIEIPYYTRVNFNSLLKLVDLLGGVDVESDYDFISLHGDYHFVKGMNHMNGKQALGFCRERYSFKDGDRQRGRNQEKVLTAIIEKMLSPSIIKDANNILLQMSDSMEMNIPQETIRNLIKQQIENGGSWNIASQSVTGTGDSTTCFSMGSAIVYVMRPDNKSVDKAKKSINNVMY